MTPNEMSVLCDTHATVWVGGEPPPLDKERCSHAALRKRIEYAVRALWVETRPVGVLRVDGQRHFHQPSVALFGPAMWNHHRRPSEHARSFHGGRVRTSASAQGAVMGRHGAWSMCFV